ncbi:hypothetical protein B0919_23310 [Hymenobacter sp. CRA2]|nr:hypothetical protein B0919_23310 [Hymenobacter sp. CRA2]
MCAQGSAALGGNSSNTNIDALTRGAPAMVYDNRLEKMHGSPYAFTRWIPGEITPANPNLRPLKAPLKYDVFHQQLLTQVNGRDSALIVPSLVMGFTLNDVVLGTDHPRRFVRFTDSPNPAYKQQFVEVLYERPNGYSLFKRYDKGLLKANYQGAYSSDKPYDELVDQPMYFLRRPDGRLVEVKLTRKALAAAAPALQAGLAKRDIKTEQDAVLALQAADTSK